MRPVVEQMVYTRLTLFLEQNPAAAKAICDKAMLARKARTAARTAREMARRKTALSGLSLPGKLADCSSKNPGECELFIVEGDQPSWPEAAKTRRFSPSGARYSMWRRRPWTESAPTRKLRP